ncbi:MAG: 2-octaprenyl-6-methoxyphenol hydroxylase, partial [Alphaproteobacteria bacterium]|nr:2-octaprenyl-6-methoxyphenol hydroxylase [Alphaproteobacteria bacterium]
NRSLLSGFLPLQGARAGDNRTTALLAGSVRALETLGVWERCREHAAPLRVMRIVDDTRRLLRAPEVRFEAHEIGLPAFGYIIENRFLLAALETRAHELPALKLIEEDADAVAVEDAKVVVTLKSGAAIAARLAIGAEGRRSLCRAAAGIATDGWNYPQTALTFNFGHSLPHHDISTEFHSESGPFTLVPLPGRRSSLVFVTDPAEAPRLAALSDEAMAAEIERRSHSILGHVTVEPGRGIFALMVETARSFGAHRIVLVGEAAHVMPPIGAQGLNLGLRDAATIAEFVVAAHRDGGDIGAADLTARYERMRRADVTSRTLAVDLLNRSLLSGFLPLQGARGLGFYLLQRIGPLRRAIMREGIMPAASQPRLMRGEVL